MIASLRIPFIICGLVSCIILMAKHQRDTYSQAIPLEMVTFNVRQKLREKNTANNWDQRLPRIAQFFSQIRPDIIGLQEPVAEQLGDIKKLLGKSYDYIGTSRGYIWSPMFDSDESTPIFYNKERLALRAHGTFRIDGEPNKVMRLLHPARYGWFARICTWGLFSDKKMDQEFLVYNTHLDHQYETARLYGLTAILRHMQQATTVVQAPVILMGDFNSSISGATQQLLDCFVNTRDQAYRLYGDYATYNGFMHDTASHCCIDHILTCCDADPNKKITVFEHRTAQEGPDGFLSDHRPVVVKLAIKAMHL